MGVNIQRPGRQSRYACSVPVVLRIDGFAFFFYANEMGEPQHVHVFNAGRNAKFWLDPVALAEPGSYDQRIVRRIERMVNEHVDTLRAAWDEFFSRREPAE